MKLVWLPIDDKSTSIGGYEAGSDLTRKLWHIGQSANRSPYRIWEWQPRRNQFVRLDTWFWDRKEAQGYVDAKVARRKSTVTQMVDLDA